MGLYYSHCECLSDSCLTNFDNCLTDERLRIVLGWAQEPNFHTLYLTLLDRLGEASGSSLGPTVVATTHKYIRILLASPRIQTHASERSLLKNLGTW